MAKTKSRKPVVMIKAKPPVVKGKSKVKIVKPVRELKPSKSSPRSALVKAVLLPARDKVKVADTWDLSALFPDVAAWEQGYEQASTDLKKFDAFKGRLSESASVLKEFFELDSVYSRLIDRLANFAFLRAAEDQGNSASQSLRQRFSHLATQVSEATAWFRPALMAMSDATLAAYMAAPELKDWALAIERIVRFRPHTLSLPEERLLAMQGQMSEASNNIFSQLNNADLKFGTVKDDKGRAIELGHATFGSLLQSPKREVRKTAFHQYYAGFDAHRNTMAASLAGSVHRDIYYARARNHATAREAALFPDNVPVSVYDNLINSVRANLPTVHRYLDVRQRAMKLKDLHQYDTYVPIFTEMRKHHTWDQAVKVVCDSLAPLGSAYVETLREGLTTARWCDRYPNRGKQSGAFSSGCFDSPPYIMMNFKEDVLEDVFTLTHEAGHSMHSWYSTRNQPYQYHDYVIFVAEVASTFNEQLLARHLMNNASSKKERAYLLNRQIDGIRSTIVRQTMFAEFERDIHAMAEAGEPLTVDSFRATYRKLLDAYFGPKKGGFIVDSELELECFRIPHFYRAFYVYKYATGLSAAIALSRRVLANKGGALDAYLGFLKGGSSQFPLDLLKTAGVDMSTPEPVDAALKQLDEMVTELDSLL